MCCSAEIIRPFSAIVCILMLTRVAWGEAKAGVGIGAQNAPTAECPAHRAAIHPRRSIIPLPSSEPVSAVRQSFARRLYSCQHMMAQERSLTGLDLDLLVQKQPGNFTSLTPERFRQERGENR